MRTSLLAAVALSLVLPTASGPAATGRASSAQARAAIEKAVANPARPAAETARDRYRHPVETLTFFGVEPGQTVVELYPSGGWYTHILMPLLAGNGAYVAVVNNTEKALGSARELVAGQPGASGARVVAADAEFAPAGSADRVLTFRNVHNLIMAGEGDGKAPAFFAAAFRALKKGGQLGVVEHRLPEEMDTAAEKKSGYVKRSTVVRLATAAGFQLAGESQVNANPKDTHDWPGGVWTLPPSYAQKDADREKYAAIGESDRMTLRFVKP